MKWSRFSIPTIKEIPNQTDAISHQLMLRAGLIRKNGSGIYSYLPLGMSVLNRLNQLIHEEMHKAGAMEVLVPILVSKDLLCQTDRWNIFSQSVLSLADRNKKDWVLGPTHEENMTSLAREQIKSYKDLPFSWYQISPKFRDEIRPRFGVIRTKEFIMKDAYSFNLDKQCLAQSYAIMRDAYQNIFHHCQLQPWILESSSGPMGGESEEFILPCDIGETVVIECSQCSYTCNLEKASRFSSYINQDVPISKKTMQLIETPGNSRIEDVCSFLDIDASQSIKSLAYYVEDADPILVMIRGDLNVDLAKLQALLGETKLIRPLDSKELTSMNLNAGFLGPFAWPYPKRVWIDYSVIDMNDALIGADRHNYHYRYFCWRRDLPELNAYSFINLHLFESDNPCPDCGASIKMKRGLELGHIFQLGDKYTKALQVSYLDAQGKSCTPLMGCYGIGVNRLIAAIIEQHHDAHGICWPWQVAPFQIEVLPLNVQEDQQMQVATQIYQHLIDEGYSVLMDDRPLRAGVKFKDADLIGIPIRIILGNRYRNDGLVELKLRSQAESMFVLLKDIQATVLLLKEKI